MCPKTARGCYTGTYDWSLVLHGEAFPDVPFHVWVPPDVETPFASSPDPTSTSSQRHRLSSAVGLFLRRGVDQRQPQTGWIRRKEAPSGAVEDKEEMQQKGSFIAK